MPAPMKVLLAHNYYRSSAPSGEDLVFRSERALLEASGVEVVAYERFNDEIDEHGTGNRLALLGSTVWSRQTYDALVRLIDQTRPDVAHFHNTLPLISPSAYAACRDRGVAVVQTLHNYRLICPGAMLLRDGRPCEDCVGTSLLPALRHRCYRSSRAATAAVVAMLTWHRARGTYERLVDRYIALTRFSAGRLIAGGVPADKIVVKPNFLADPPAETAPPAAPGEAYAVYVGRLSAEKGVRVLLDAWRQVPDLPLKIVGDGALRGELETFARSHRLNVHFLGFQAKDEVLRLIAGARCQVIPSICYEGFPLVIAEAFACGTPVLASALGSLGELIRPGETGLVFKAGDAADLARQLQAFVTQPDPNPWRAACRRQFEAEYTADRNLEILLRVYREAIAAHERTRRCQERP